MLEIKNLRSKHVNPNIVSTDLFSISLTDIQDVSNLGQTVLQANLNVHPRFNQPQTECNHNQLLGKYNQLNSHLSSSQQMGKISQITRIGTY